ncbi:uncharacterized protein BDW43DRAFT_258044 [Aspergillus alliaceus]|uniref:uncharacterized protein n=1 Tax=Petromyces alliaceus TaxID=209559 RepID=UPI0012A72D06|nr:uncharacterized protein BDW43DRAFT_258044 [Aspergillus alliaceus]KAB8239437.1 hypothetical protein BDW43DRAFT_258044 [Aspergillus alliaceus]
MMCVYGTTYYFCTVCIVVLYTLLPHPCMSLGKQTPVKERECVCVKVCVIMVIVYISHS